jgi:hypothetical protein
MLPAKVSPRERKLTLRATGLIAPLLALMLAVGAASCSTVSGNSAALKTGMTAGQAVEVMGPPDLKDSVADPSHPGATVLRYVWVDSGKIAVFGSNDRIASIQQIQPAAATKQQIEEVNRPPTPFDPIDTPLNYAFFPIRAGLIYFGAALNCVTGGGCHKPQLPSPDQG